MLALAAVPHGHAVEGDRAQVLIGIRIVDIRHQGALPWVLTVDSAPGSITVTIRRSPRQPAHQVASARPSVQAHA